MSVEFIIQDTSIKYDKPNSIIEEGLLYTGDTWCTKMQNAKKYTDVTNAINDAKILQKELPVRVLSLERVGNRVGVGIINI